MLRCSQNAGSLDGLDRSSFIKNQTETKPVQSATALFLQGRSMKLTFQVFKFLPDKTELCRIDEAVVLPVRRDNSRSW